MGDLNEDFFEKIQFAKNVTVDFRQDKLEIHTTEGDTAFLYSNIKNTKFVFPVYLFPGKLILEAKDGPSHTISVPARESELYQELKRKIDEMCEINAYEKSTHFARAPFVSGFSVSNILIILIVLPLAALHFLAGVLVCLIPEIGLFIGIPLIVLALAAIIAIIHNSTGAVEGECPICGNILKTNRRTKQLYCFKCKEKILVKDNYFEY